jgi:hypothetical protein
MIRERTFHGRAASNVRNGWKADIRICAGFADLCAILQAAAALNLFG